MAGKGGYIAASSAALLDNISKPVSILRRLRHWRLQAILVLSLSAGLCGVFYAGGGAWPGRSSALLEIRDRNAHDHVALFLSQTARKSQQRWHTKRKFAHALEPQAAQQISYAGIVPYVVHRHRVHPQAVACGGTASSVACVLSAAENELQGEMARGRTDAGKAAVEQAAKGRGFAPWDVSHQNKAARVAARRRIATSSAWHGACALPLTECEQFFVLNCARRDRDSRIQSVPNASYSNCTHCFVLKLSHMCSSFLDQVHLVWCSQS